MITQKKIERKCQGFVQAAIEQDKQLKAQKMVDDWYRNQESPWADIKFHWDVIESIENQTGADLSHLKR